MNTVRAVYARLEEQGLIVTSHGRGSYVAEDAGGSPEVERIAGEAIESARAAGVDPRDVAITTLVSAALPEALDAGLPRESEPQPRISIWTDSPPSSSSTTRGSRRTRARRGASSAVRSGGWRPSSPRTRATCSRPSRVPARRAPDRRRRPARADPGRAAQPARRGAGVGATAVAARAPGPRGPRRHGRRSRRAPVGGRLERRHRRGGLRHLGGRTTDGTARRVDELVADQGLGRMPVTRAAGGGGS